MTSWILCGGNGVWNQVKGSDWSQYFIIYYANHPLHRLGEQSLFVICMHAREQNVGEVRCLEKGMVRLKVHLRSRVFVDELNC